MIADRRLISRKWNKKLQSDFENALVFFNSASEEDRGKFEKGGAGGGPEQKALFAISQE